MSDTFVSQKVAVLVDVQNLYHSARAQFQGRVRFDKLLEGIKNNRSLIRAIAYIVQKPDVEQSGFLDALERFGFDLRVKEMKMRQSREEDRLIPTRTSWEVGLALDAAELCHKVDSVAIVSGDGCYLPLVQYLKAHGCRAEVYAFENSVSAELMKSADRFVAVPKEWTMPEKEKIEPEDIPEEDESQPISNVSRLGVFGKQ